MGKRKQYVIDKKFQLRTTFAVIGIIFVVGILIVAAIGITVTLNNGRLNNVVQIHRNIGEAMLVITQSITDESASAPIKNLSANFDRNVAVIQKIITLNTVLLFAIIGIVLIQGVVVFVVLLKKTHTISGPIYVMSGYIKEIINGRIPHMRSLRKGDELQDFYALFRQMVDRIKQGGFK